MKSRPVRLPIRCRALNSLLKFSSAPTCERLVSGGIAEPINQISTLLVSVLAIYALTVWRKEGRGDPLTLGLSLLAIVIGLGGFVYHGAPSDQHILFEVMPPILFMVGCFACILKRMFNLETLVSLLNIAGFTLFGAFFIAVLPADALGGGARYIVPLFALYIVAVTLILKARVGLHEDRSLVGAAAQRSDAQHFPKLRAGYGLLQAGILLAMALAARALDAPLCGTVPGGLHPVWHVLAGVAAIKILLVCIRFPYEAKAAPDFAPRRGL